MSLYHEKVNRIKEICFSNELQLGIVIKIKNDLDSNYSQNINLNSLATSHHISKFHLIRVFKKYYGTTPRQYLINKRIKRAKIYLKEGKSVKETCFMVGFTSIQSFSILFKRKTGKSPSAYK